MVLLLSLALDASYAYTSLQTVMQLLRSISSSLYHFRTIKGACNCVSYIYVYVYRRESAMSMVS